MRVRLPETFIAELAPGTTLTRPMVGNGWMMGFVTILEYAPPCKKAMN